MGEADPAGDLPYSFQFVEAPADLRPYCNSLYIFRAAAPGFDDWLPAYSGQLAIVTKGTAEMTFEKGRKGRTGEVVLMGPLLKARQFRINGPMLMLGVSLNFRGWAALTGLPVNENHDDFLPPEKALAPALLQRLAALPDAIRSGALDESAALDEMASVVRAGLHELSVRHVQVIDTTLEWLSSSFKPDINVLQDKLPYSERQVQRLVTRFFGQPPVRLIRRYRAVRAATLLSLPELPLELEAEIRDAFYDQAHMIKEIRAFTGRTPRRLEKSTDTPVKDMLGPDGYSSVDLFGGSQDRQLGRASR